jgi:hypothetical protein
VFVPARAQSLAHCAHALRKPLTRETAQALAPHALKQLSIYFPLIFLYVFLGEIKDRKRKESEKVNKINIFFRYSHCVWKGTNKRDGIPASWIAARLLIYLLEE